jgi:hypothetical protein
MKLHIEQNSEAMADAAVDSVVIFAIDNGADPRTRARFERHIDTLRAMGSLKRPIRLCVGMWKGQIETSYEMVRSDFEQHVMQQGWVAQQEAILGVVAGQAVIIDRDGKVQSVGRWKKVDAGYAMAFCDGWTFFLDSGEYWVAE